MATPSDKISTKLFIGGLSSQTSQEDLLKYFSAYGEITDCVVMYDKVTGRSRGFGFVTFKAPESVDQALSQKHKINDKELDCNRAIPRAHDDDPAGGNASKKTKKLFVGGLPQGLPEEEFRQYFEQFGKIEDSVIMMDRETGKSRGFGFITFDNEDSVEKVIEQYNENKIDGKWIECKKAMPRDGNDHRDGGSGGKRKFDRDDRFSAPRSQHFGDKDRSFGGDRDRGGFGGRDRGDRERGRFGDRDNDRDRGGRDRGGRGERGDRDDRSRDRGGRGERGDRYGRNDDYNGDRQNKSYSQGYGGDSSFGRGQGSYVGSKDYSTGASAWGSNSATSNYDSDPSRSYTSGLNTQQYGAPSYTAYTNPSVSYPSSYSNAQPGGYSATGNTSYNYGGNQSDPGMIQPSYLATQPSYMGAQTTGSVPSTGQISSYGAPTQTGSYGGGDNQYSQGGYQGGNMGGAARPVQTQAYNPSSYPDPSSGGGPIKGNSFQGRGDDRYYKPY